MVHKDIFRLAQLIFRKFLDDLSKQEQVELTEWENSSPAYQELSNNLSSTDFYKAKRQESRIYDAVKAYRRFEQRKHKNRKRVSYRRLAIGIAALLVVSVGLTFLFLSKPLPLESPQSVITAGESRAILTFADGKKLQLMGDMTDTVVRCDGLPVNVTQGKVEYSVMEREETKAVLYNELTVPRKGEFRLTLADGTKVWLNSESKLKYPIRFKGTERQVWLEGEAYFEVAPNTCLPFIVHLGQASVKVLGTSFNVRAYRDEPDIYATLVKGKVKLFSGSNEMELLPDEQGVIQVSSGKIRKTTVEAYLYAAWKDGRFIFQEQRLEEIMNTLARWYDIEVFFSSQAVRDVTFTGNLKRYDNFDRIVRMLEMTGMAHFRIDDKILYISN